MEEWTGGSKIYYGDKINITFVIIYKELWINRVLFLIKKP